MFIQNQLGDAELNDDNPSFFKAFDADYLTINALPFTADDKGPLSTFEEMSDYLKWIRSLAEKTACS